MLLKLYVAISFSITIVVNGLKDKTTHSDSADCHDFLDVKFE